MFYFLHNIMSISSSHNISGRCAAFFLVGAKWKTADVLWIPTMRISKLMRFFKQCLNWDYDEGIKEIYRKWLTHRMHLTKCPEHYCIRDVLNTYFWKLMNYWVAWKFDSRLKFIKYVPMHVRLSSCFFLHINPKHCRKQPYASSPSLRQLQVALKQ